MAVSKATLRRASRADRTVLRALHRALYVDHHGSIVPASIAPLLEYRDFERVLRDDIDGLIDHPNAAVLVAERDGRVVGYITGHMEEEPERRMPRRGVVEDWFVEPAARGERIGAALLAALEDVFREARCDLIESATWSFNEGAVRAHEALGFEAYQVRFRKPLR
jgi:GNAT superfamily N-acetyltransferase